MSGSGIRKICARVDYPNSLQESQIYNENGIILSISFRLKNYLYCLTVAPEGRKQFLRS